MSDRYQRACVKCVTYHNGHCNKLEGGKHCQQGRHHLPATFPLVSAAEKDDGESNQGRQLNDDSEVHDEADAAPHGAEVSVLAMAVFVLRKGGTSARQARAALVQPIRDVDWCIWVFRVWALGRRCIGHPIWKGDCSEGQGSCCKSSSACCVE